MKRSSFMNILFGEDDWRMFDDTFTIYIQREGPDVTKVTVYPESNQDIIPSLKKEILREDPNREGWYVDAHGRKNDEGNVVGLEIEVRKTRGNEVGSRKTGENCPLPRDEVGGWGVFRDFAITEQDLRKFERSLEQLSELRREIASFIERFAMILTRTEMHR